MDKMNKSYDKLEELFSFIKKFCPLTSEKEVMLLQLISVNS